jgi:LCP family protein required for cell wall assembly
MAVVTVAALLPGMLFAWVTVRQDAVLDTVFGGAGDAKVAVPSPLGELGLTTAPTTEAAVTSVATAPLETSSTAPSSVTSTAAPSVPAATRPRVTAESSTVPGLYSDEVGRWNIALLGGDAGPRRWSLRTDTMIVISIDRQTGDLAGVSVPRNLQHLPMPPGPLRDRFPAGFSDLANALWPYVSTHPDLGLDPSEAIKGALAELLGIPIHNYVLVDMAGFVKIIDALGGVTVDLSTKVPLVPNMDGKTKEAPFVGPGSVTMNGTMALSFVRTRNADSDYQRMKRQRCLLAAVAKRTSPSDLARNYPGLASAVEGAFRSDIPRDKLGDLVRLFVRVDVGQARTLVLVPPVIQPAHPDIGLIRSLVATALDRAAAAANPAISQPTC